MSDYEMLSCVRLMHFVNDLYSNNRRLFAFAIYVLTNPLASTVEIAKHFRCSTACVRSRMFRLSAASEEFDRLLALRQETFDSARRGCHLRDNRNDRNDGAADDEGTPARGTGCKVE